MRKFIADIKKYIHYIFYASRAELKSEVADSYLNWIWWILEPVCFMAIYAFVFKFFFKGTVEYLTPFIFIGITMWEFFNKMLKISVKLVRSSKAIVSKVYIPKYILVLVKLSVNTFKMAISFGIVIVLMLINRVTVSIQLLWAIPILISFLIFTFGICTIFMHFGVFIEDLTNITNIALRLLFYITGVFYNLADKMTGNLGIILIRINPLALFITSIRDVLLYSTMPNLLYLGIWSLIGIVFAYFGIKLVQKNENSYVKVM